jgi:hypothetical protein
MATQRKGLKWWGVSIGIGASLLGGVLAGFTLCDKVNAADPWSAKKEIDGLDARVTALESGQEDIKSMLRAVIKATGAKYEPPVDASP